MAHSRKAYGELADSSPTRSVWPRAGRALSEEISDFGCKVVAQYATTTLQTPFLHGARDQCGISQNRVSEACQGGAAALRLDCRANRPTERRAQFQPGRARCAQPLGISGGIQPDRD